MAAILISSAVWLTNTSAVISNAFATIEPNTCFGLPATKFGTPGNDNTLVGTPGPDVIVSLGGNDIIQGLGGDDHICGEDGNDRIDGG